MRSRKRSRRTPVRKRNRLPNWNRRRSRRETRRGNSGRRGGRGGGGRRRAFSWSFVIGGEGGRDLEFFETNVERTTTFSLFFGYFVLL